MMDVYIKLKIPEEFIYDYEKDKFTDCLYRILLDLFENPEAVRLAGNYEKETLEMLIAAFRYSKKIHE